MDKDKIIIIAIIVLVIISIACFVYDIYIKDYTYEDDLISMIVPAQTEFEVYTTDSNNSWASIDYSSNDKNNITVDIKKLESSTTPISESELDIFNSEKTSLLDDLTGNKNYEFVEDTDYYTLYQNKEINRYVALIFAEEEGIIITIACDDSSELINKIADSFVLISFDTTGLPLKNDNISTNTTAENDIDGNNTSKDTSKTNSSDSTSNSNKSNNKNPNYVKNGDVYTDENGVSGTYRENGYYDDSGNELVG